MTEAIDKSVHELEVPEEMLPDGESEFTKDDMFHLLQNQRRRDVLRYLRDTEGAVRMRDVAEQVAAWENDTTVKRLSSDQRQRVYIALYQSHLPALDEEGVIDYNQDRGYVEPRPLIETLEPYLDDPDTDEDADDGETAADGHTWRGYYFAVGAIATTLFAAAQLGLVGVSMDLLFASVIGLLGTVVGLDATRAGDLPLDGDGD